MAARAPIRAQSLLGEYALLLSDAVLRNDIRRLEEATRVKARLARAFQSELASRVNDSADTPLSTLVDFSSFLARRCGTHDDPELIEKYALLVEMAAGRLLESFDEILARPDEGTGAPPSA
jgi:hypothetical protein